MSSHKCCEGRGCGYCSYCYGDCNICNNLDCEGKKCGECYTCYRKINNSDKKEMNLTKDEAILSKYEKIC